MQNPNSESPGSGAIIYSREGIISISYDRAVSIREERVGVREMVWRLRKRAFRFVRNGRKSSVLGSRGGIMNVGLELGFIAIGPELRTLSISPT